MEFLGFNSADKSIVYTSNEANPIQENVYAVSETNLKRTALDDGEGVHNAELSASGKFVFDRGASPRLARYICVTNTSNAVRTELETIEKHPWEV